jgi:predicted GH43/DUF377 family glycosyl hydrolase
VSTRTCSSRCSTRSRSCGLPNSATGRSTPASSTGHTIIAPADGAFGVGAGAPPVEVDGELVLFYHERDRRSRYTTKVALLDDRTGRVKAALTEPIIEPELTWERTGDVDEVVFVQGAVARPDGTIYLTYGAADRHVGAATVETAPLLDALRAAA